MRGRVLTGINQLTDEELIMNRPEIVTDAHLTYLDILRDSAVTNMFGAGTYLVDEFDLSPRDARTVLQYWMSSYGDDER